MPAQQSLTLSVEGMSCGHCTNAIEKGIKAADATASVNCDLSDRTVQIETNLSVGQIIDIMKAEGYDSAPA